MQKAKDARLAAAGEIDTGPPKHVLEGHADKQDLLGWGTNVCARGRQDQKWAEEDMRRQFKPLKKINPHEYIAAFDKENLEARKESEHIWENAREKAQRKRREREKALREFRPKDVTPGKKKHDSGVGQLTDGEIAKISAEIEREEAEEVREDMRRAAERIANNDRKYSGETQKTRNARERLTSTVGMSMADMEAEINDIKGVADTPDMDQLRDLRRSSLDKPEIQRMTSDIDKEIPHTIREENSTSVMLPTPKNVAGIHGKEVDDESKATPDIPAIEDMVPKQQGEAKEHIIKNIGQMQDIQDATNKRNTTQGKHDGVMAKLVRGESEKIVDGVVQPQVPVHPSMLKQNPDGTAVEPPPTLPSRSPKRRSVIPSLAGPPDQVKVEEKEVNPFSTPDIQEATFAQGSNSEESRTFDDVSPKSQANDTSASNDNVKVAEQGNAADVKPTSDTGTDSGSSKKVHKWAKGTEGEEARMEGGVSPKSVRVGSAVMSVDALGYGDSVDGKDEGYFAVKKGEEEADKEEKEKEVREMKEKGEAEKRTSEWVHGKEEEKEDDKEDKKAESQDKTNTDGRRKTVKVGKWVKGKEGEEARMEGGVSPKSVRVGSVIMSVDENKCYGTASESGESMMSAKSKFEESEEMKLGGGERSKQDVQESMEESMNERK